VFVQQVIIFQTRLFAVDCDLSQLIQLRPCHEVAKDLFILSGVISLCDGAEAASHSETCRERRGTVSAPEQRVLSGHLQRRRPCC